MAVILFYLFLNICERMNAKRGKNKIASTKYIADDSAPLATKTKSTNPSPTAQDKYFPELSFIIMSLHFVFFSWDKTII